jgi:elongation factor G
VCSIVSLGGTYCSDVICLYPGTLTRQTALLNTTRNQRERVSKLLLLYASEAKEVHELHFGSVGVLLGLKHTRTGDTLVSPSSVSSVSLSSSLRDIRPPAAVISASVIPRSHSDLEPVQEALQSLTRTDPSVRVETQEGQLLVHGLGALHLEIVEGRLKDEWDARFEFGRRRVSYREGLGCAVQEAASDSWQTDLAGKQVTIHLSLSVRPMTDSESGDPNWDGNILVDSNNTPLPIPSASADLLSPLASIARGISGALSHSPHTSLPMSNIHVRVNSYSYPLNAPSILAGASAVIMRNRIRDAGIGPVMEPYVQLKVTINEDSLGKVIKDLTENGGEMEDIESESAPVGDGADGLERFTMKGGYVPPDWLSPSSSSSSTKSTSGPRLRRSIHAVAPLSKMLDYSNRLRALSGGHGVFEMSNVGFRVVSEARTLEILKEIGRA